MNEEDIKLVERLIKEFKTYNDLDGIQDLSPYIKAIENLINRNKELEEENKNYKKYAVMMSTEGLIINGVKFSFNDYIPKSKVKEYKEKFIKDSKEEKVFMTQSSQINASLISFCNELLEE